MNHKKLLLTAFILVALVQLYVPAKMILHQEEILETGKIYKFKTAPIDPTDPFRGKYITLSYVENVVKVGNQKDWNIGETIYALFEIDNNGFAKIKSVSKEKPIDEEYFLKTKVNNLSFNDSTQLTIDYAFDRYYMEESKAYEAEQHYRKAQVDTNQTTYALVSIKKGDAVLKDVLINEIPIREIVIKERTK